MSVFSAGFASWFVVVGGVFFSAPNFDFGLRSQADYAFTFASARQGTLPGNVHPVRVYYIPQIDCPVTIEQQENAQDGSLRSVDVQNHGGEAVASLRVGWNIRYEDSAKAPDQRAGRVVELRPSLKAGARATLSEREIGAAPIVEGARRLEMYVASGYFESGAKFTCSTASAKSGF